MFANFIVWWNTGRDVRVFNENTASWLTLLKDDFSQITLTDSAFKKNKHGILYWRPLKAFSFKQIATGPTPLIRQIVERPFKLFFGESHENHSSK